MKNIIKNIRSAVAKAMADKTAAALSAGLLLAFSLQPSAFGQATTLVKPRQMTLLSNVLLAAKQNLATNATGTATNALACWTNTLTPFSGAHPIGLTAIIQTTNNLSGASNVVVNVYPAYDVSGGVGATGIGTAWGTNFATVPIFTWTISYTTNSVQCTNLPSALWEPATSLGYTVSNGVNSNTTFTLIQSQCP
jgi:hypothetical protein